MNVKIKVYAGENILKEFEGYQRIGSGWQTARSLESAITYAVIEMLGDSEIIGYLTM